MPQAAADFFGRELTYTGLTRAQESLTLFVEKDLGPLLGLRKRAAAATPRRNSRLFETTLGLDAGYRASGLVHVTSRGEHVRSKSEVIIANLLHKYELEKRLSYTYEEELAAPGSNGRDLRLPDFTVHVAGEVFYWEHCGKVDDPAYMERWEEVRRPWYKRNGFEDRLIETRDGPGGTIDSEVIERDVHSREASVGLTGGSTTSKMPAARVSYPTATSRRDSISWRLRPCRRSRFRRCPVSSRTMFGWCSCSRRASIRATRRVIAKIETLELRLDPRVGESP